MHALAMLTSAAAFASFGWGVLRFFQRSSAPSPWQTATALLGLAFSAGQMYAIAIAATAPWRGAAAAAAHAAALLMFWNAVRACEQRTLTAIFEADTPQRVVRRGPYRLVRHPFYTAYTIYWLAGFVASGSPLTLVSTAVMVLIYVRGARAEERKFARSPLAREYDAYRLEVGAFLPRLRRRAATAAR